MTGCLAQDGRPLLGIAASAGHTSMVKLLLDRGANVEGCAPVSNALPLGSVRLSAPLQRLCLQKAIR